MICELTSARYRDDSFCELTPSDDVVLGSGRGMSLSSSLQANCIPNSVLMELWASGGLLSYLNGILVLLSPMSALLSGGVASGCNRGVGGSVSDEVMEEGNDMVKQGRILLFLLVASSIGTSVPRCSMYRV